MFAWLQDELHIDERGDGTTIPLHIYLSSGNYQSVYKLWCLNHTYLYVDVWIHRNTNLLSWLDVKSRDQLYHLTLCDVYTTNHQVLGTCNIYLNGPKVEPPYESGATQKIMIALRD